MNCDFNFNFVFKWIATKKIHRVGKNWIQESSQNLCLPDSSACYRYASHDALNTKKRYSHVQSKVKVYIENMRREDQERRQISIERHRSEPSKLAEWHTSDANDSSAIDWQLVVEQKNVEVDEMKLRLYEMKSYGDAMNELLNSERLRVRF